MKKRRKASVAVGKGESAILVEAGEAVVEFVPLRTLSVERSSAVDFWRRFKLEVSEPVEHIAELYLGHAFYRGASPEALDILSRLAPVSEAQKKQISERWVAKTPTRKVVPLRKRKVGA